jgi:sugar phosphate isomerase/epimerase
MFSDPDVYEYHSESYLKEIKARADALGLEIEPGMLSICPSSVIFNPQRGTAEEQLAQTIWIAKILKSPIARCVLGKVDDRRSPGGIEARIAETVTVLKNVRTLARDSGVKLAVENHAGDMQAWELVNLIEEAGPDFVGATLDTGNATWALEDPRRTLELLGPYALTTGIRDSALWKTDEGAMLEWTAMGDGMVDWPTFFKRFQELCPNVSVQLELISGRHTPLRYGEKSFWDAYPKARQDEFEEFEKLVGRGTPRPLPPVFSGPDALKAQGEFQRAELERSVKYCREVLGLGRASK